MTSNKTIAREAAIDIHTKPEHNNTVGQITARILAAIEEAEAVNLKTIRRLKHGNPGYHDEGCKRVVWDYVGAAGDSPRFIDEDCDCSLTLLPPPEGE